MVKNLPATQETLVRSLGWEDPPENRKATYCSILAWRIPWTVQSMGSQRVIVGHDWATFTSFLQNSKSNLPRKRSSQHRGKLSSPKPPAQPPSSALLLVVGFIIKIIKGVVTVSPQDPAQSAQHFPYNTALSFFSPHRTVRLLRAETFVPFLKLNLGLLKQIEMDKIPRKQWDRRNYFCFMKWGILSTIHTISTNLRELNCHEH